MKYTHNARLIIDHTYPNQSAYVKFLYDMFSNLSGKTPNIMVRKPDKRTNKIYSSICFKTYNLACLNLYHSLFYKSNDLTNVKTRVQFKKKGTYKYTRIINSYLISSLGYGRRVFH